MSRRRRGLTPEEQELWSRIARSATPIDPGGKPRRDLSSFEPAPRPTPAKPMPAQPAPAVQAEPLPRFRIGQAARLHDSTAQDHAPSPAQRLAGHPLSMDHKTHRRMSQGKLRPEARLDLHGMTLAAAQPELTRFVLSCHSRGMRLVLVITGKGRGDHGPLPTRPGALRHQVPHWLHSPPLSTVVQQVTAAHYRHGGEGAYYVYLRRPAG